MAILVHGTTRKRAEKILKEGPNPYFREPLPHSGEPAGSRVESFSTYLESGPFTLSPPEEYARRKFSDFPDEGGPVILKVDVPDEIIALAVDDGYLPLSQGIVQFDEGAGLEELRAAWPRLLRWFVTVEDQ
jgi:hypothetical protein